MADLFYVFAPCGLAYGHAMTFEQALKTVEHHSLYPGEPNWTIAPADSDIRAVLRTINARMEAESRERLAALEARIAGDSLRVRTDEESSSLEVE